jgi:hypothetical protein
VPGALMLQVHQWPDAPSFTQQQTGDKEIILPMLFKVELLLLAEQVQVVLAFFY